MTSGMPIKRSPHIAALSRDHHHALLLGWKIRQGIKLNREVSRICAYVVHFYKKYVEQHFMAEETLLFHQLPDGDELKHRAISEHHMLRGLFSSLSDKSDYEQLNLIADKLDQHIRFEERVLFPHLEKIIPVEELEKVGKALAAETHAEDVWEDEFWKKPV